MNDTKAELLRAYCVELRSAAPRHIWLALGLMCGVALTEWVGLLLLVSLLQAVGLGVAEGGIGKLEQWTSGAFAAVGVRPTLLGVLCVYVVTISVQSFLQRWQVIVSSTLDEHFLLHLRRRLYRAVLQARWLFLTRRRLSDFTHALTTELDRVGEMSYLLFSLFIQLLVASVYLLLALHLSPVMTCLAALSGVGLLLLLRGYTRRAHVRGEELTEAVETMFAAATEHLGGLKTAKGYGAEERTFGIFSSISERVARVEVDTTRSYADASAWFRIGSVVVLSAVVYVAIRGLHLSIAEVLLLLFVFSRLVPKFSSIQQDYQYLLNSLPAYANVRERISSCEAAAETSGDLREPLLLERAIRYDRVSFSYGGEGDSPAVAELDLVIPARQTTAITGPSGAGKSTIADLLIGLIVPDRGCVRVDGAPLIPEKIRAWRDQIGYVAQDAVLFHDSVRGNLLWAAPTAGEEDVWAALRLAAADRFVTGLPQGLDTVIGDRGVRLSGGERQRLALACALLRKPSLLILDEATSALDSESERRIQESIADLHGRLTILVISHRLSTIREADRIHVLEGGRIVESGTWDELISRARRFSELCIAQGIGLGEPATPTPSESRRVSSM
ncbi:ABC transporter ATP-binding protein [soil metagenome]